MNTNNEGIYGVNPAEINVCSLLAEKASAKQKLQYNADPQDLRRGTE